MSLVFLAHRVQSSMSVDDNLVPASSGDGLLVQLLKQRRDVALVATARTRRTVARRRSVTADRLAVDCRGRAPRGSVSRPIVIIAVRLVSATVQL